MNFPIRPWQRDWEPTPVRQVSPDELRELRAVMGLSQEGLAVTLGVSISAVQKWERGSRRPCGPYLERILHHLDRLPRYREQQRRA